MTEDDKPTRLFTVEQANQTLPLLRPLLERLKAAHEAMEERYEAVMASVPGNGGGDVHQEFLEASEEASTVGAEIEELGAVVRDPAVGLIDLPAERDGELVYLCWRLDEERVGWWHGTDTGFAGRRPL